MNIVRASALGLALALAGFGGAQAFGGESPPLVANCVNAADGWAVEVLGIDCTRAGQIVGTLVQRRPNGTARARGMTCTVGYAGKIPVAIRCTGPRSSFLRANAYLPGKAKAPQLPKLRRCSDYVDALNRRWAIRRESFSCIDATTIVNALATRRVQNGDETYTERLEALAKRVAGVPCQAAPDRALPRLIGCGGWVSPRFGSPLPIYSGFTAEVKPAATPSPTPGTTTVRRP